MLLPENLQKIISSSKIHHIDPTHSLLLTPTYFTYNYNIDNTITLYSDTSTPPINNTPLKKLQDTPHYSDISTPPINITTTEEQDSSSSFFSSEETEALKPTISTDNQDKDGSKDTNNTNPNTNNSNTIDNTFYKFVPTSFTPPPIQHSFPYKLDPFQLQSIYLLSNNKHTLVTAHTSSGKTLIAHFLFNISISNNTTTIYTSPLKALCNQKYYNIRNYYTDIERADNPRCGGFSDNDSEYHPVNNISNEQHPVNDKDSDYHPINPNPYNLHPVNTTTKVGIITGDTKINVKANILIVTTEILRNMLYTNTLPINTQYVIFDEIHYISNKDRGVVWEECLLLLPRNITLLLLSATTPYPQLLGNWIGRIREETVYIVSTCKRVVPLIYYMYSGEDIIEISKGIYVGRKLEGVRYHSSDRGVGVNKRDNEQQGVINNINKQHGVSNSINKKQGVSNSIHKQQGVNKSTDKQEGVSNSINKQEGVNKSTDKQQGVSNSIHKQQGVSNSIDKSSLFNNNTNAINTLLHNPTHPYPLNILSIAILNNLTPTLFFCFSKKRISKYTNTLYSFNTNLLSNKEKMEVETIISKYIKECVGSNINTYTGISIKTPLDNSDVNNTPYSYTDILTLPQFILFKSLALRGIATHHSSLIPFIKEITEILFNKSLLKIIICTETFSMGVNLPVKCVIFDSYYKQGKLLSNSEFVQMSGRAGRRGIYDKGVVVINGIRDRSDKASSYKGGGDKASSYKGVNHTTNKQPPFTNYTNTYIHNINNTLVVLRDIIFNTTNTLYSCSSFKLSYNMILCLLINNINIMEFLKRTFMEDKVQREYKGDMDVIRKEEEGVSRVECSVCGVIGREEIWGVILRIMGDGLEGVNHKGSAIEGVNDTIDKQHPINNTMYDYSNLTPPLLNYLYLLYEVCNCYNILITKGVLCIGMGVVIKKGNLYGIIKDIKGDNITISNNKDIDLVSDKDSRLQDTRDVNNNTDKQHPSNNTTNDNTNLFTLPSYPHIYIFPVKEDLVITIKDIFYITEDTNNTHIAKDTNYDLSNCYVEFPTSSIEGVIIKERLKRVLIKLTGVNNRTSCLKGCYPLIDNYKSLTGVNNTTSCLKGCYNLLDHYRVLLHSFYSLENIYFLFNKHSSQHLSLISEYYMRIRVLKYIKCISENNRVLLKGRVSIEIRSCYDLIGMCLIFNGVLGNISGEEIMGVISCIIEGVNIRGIEGGVSSITSINTHNTNPYTNTPDTNSTTNPQANTPFATYLYPFTSEKQDLFIKLYNIVDNTYNHLTNIITSFTLQPMYIPCYYYILPVYDWCIGKDLLYINNTYGIQEGDMIKVVLRLIEVCKELKGVSVLIGDVVLYNKIEEVEKCINRGVISIPSVYHSE